MSPRVSVLLPVRNGLPWLREALDGLSRQTLHDFEVLALEDGSTDGTAEFLAAWPDDRVRVIRTGGVGIAAALNIGLDAAHAPLIARQDADDVSAPERLALQADYLCAHSDIGVLATVADYIDADGRDVNNDWVRTIRTQHDVALTPARIHELMPLTCCLTHGSVMARAGVLRAQGGYRQETAPAEDYDLWLRLLPRTPMAKLPQRLYRYRVHGGQLSAQARDQQLVQTLAAKLRYLRHLFPRLPTPARLVIIGSGRGAAGFRALAPSHGFVPAPVPPALEHANLATPGNAPGQWQTLHGCDALVVTDFDTLEAYESALCSGGEAVRVGNFFVPCRQANQRTG